MKLDHGKISGYISVLLGYLGIITGLLTFGMVLFFKEAAEKIFFQETTFLNDIGYIFFLILQFYVAYWGYKILNENKYYRVNAIVLFLIVGLNVLYSMGNLLLPIDLEYIFFEYAWLVIPISTIASIPYIINGHGVAKKKGFPKKKKIRRLSYAILILFLIVEIVYFVYYFLFIGTLSEEQSELYVFDVRASFDFMTPMQRLIDDILVSTASFLFLLGVTLLISSFSIPKSE
ncbi:hypothetical protein HYU50_02540 [Candidatus Woesearchaeota archaeon]|nr:hypothetical protein [Candidatus Woesearchaeota archaeon]